MPATAAMTAPPVVVFRRLPEEMAEMAKLVEVAEVVVEFKASKPAKWEVEEAKRPAWAQMGVPVAEAVTP